MYKWPFLYVQKLRMAGCLLTTLPHKLAYPLQFLQGLASSEDWSLSNYLERMNQGPGMITNIYNTHYETTSLCYSVPSHVSRPVSACNMEKRISPRRAAKKGRAACTQRLLAHKTRQIKRKLLRVPLHKTLRTRLESANTQEKFPAKTHRERTPGATNTPQPQPVVWR